MFHLSSLRIQAGRRATDQFPPAEIDATVAGQRLCRQGPDPCRVRGGSPAEIPVLQLWRRHVDRLI